MQPRWPLLAALTVLIAPVSAPAGSGDRTVVKLGEPAPPLEATHPDGNALLRSHLEHKVVLVAFWKIDPTTGSGMPLGPLRTVRHRFRNDPRFLILTVCIPDDQTDSEDWGRYIAGQGRVNYGDGERRFLDDPKWWNTFQNDLYKPPSSVLYGVSETPTFFLIDVRGRMASTHIPPEDLQGIVEKALGPSAP